MRCACEFCWSRCIAGLISLNMTTSSSCCSKEDLNHQTATSMGRCLQSSTILKQQGSDTPLRSEVRLSLRSRHFKSSKTTITMSLTHRPHQIGVIRVDAINYMYTQECLISDYTFLHNTIIQNEHLFVLTWWSVCAIDCSNLLDIVLGCHVLQPTLTVIRPSTTYEKHKGFRLLDYTSVKESIDRSITTHELSVPKRLETAYYHLDNKHVAGITFDLECESRTHRTRRKNNEGQSYAKGHVHV